MSLSRYVLAATMVFAVGCSALPASCPTQAMTRAGAELERRYDDELNQCVKEAQSEVDGLACMVEVDERYGEAFRLYSEQRQEMQRCTGGAP